MDKKHLIRWLLVAGTLLLAALILRLFVTGTSVVPYLLGAAAAVILLDLARKNWAALAGLFKVRECAVKTTPRKQPRRYLLAFRKHHAELEQTEGVIETAPNERSAWYQELTKDFYL